MKKVFAMLLVMLMVMGTASVCAAGNPVLTATLNATESGNDSLIVEVTDAPLGSLMSVAVFREGGLPAFLEELRVKESAPKLTFNFTPEYGLSGELLVQVSFSGSDTQLTKTVYYYSYPEQKRAIELIMDSETPETEIINQKDILNINLDGLYSRVTDKEAIADRLVAKLETLDTVDAEVFNTEFANSVLITALNQKDVSLLADILDANLTNFNAMTQEKEWYDAQEDQTAVLDAVKTGSYETAEEFNNVLGAQLFIGQLNAAHVKNMLGLLEYADEHYIIDEEIFDLDLEAYDDLNTAQKEYFVTQLGITYKTLEDVQETFDTALTKAQKYKEKKESGTSGGSSSSGGRGDGVVARVQSDLIPDGPAEPSIENNNGGDKGFTDIAAVEWAKEAITAFAAEGIVSGTGNNQFSPDNSVTREQFVKMLLGAFKINVQQNGQNAMFTDVKQGEWYYDYVQTAVSLGLASGYGDSFGVGDSITREDMAVMIYNCAKQKGVTLNAEGEEVPADYAEISGYAKEAVTSMYQAGIINGIGEGQFAPKMHATRAQAVKLLYELWRVAA